jgi:hypothetical protein
MTTSASLCLSFLGCFFDADQVLAQDPSEARKRRFFFGSLVHRAVPCRSLGEFIFTYLPLGYSQSFNFFPRINSPSLTPCLNCAKNRVLMSSKASVSFSAVLKCLVKRLVKLRNEFLDLRWRTFHAFAFYDHRAIFH